MQGVWHRLMVVSPKRIDKVLGSDWNKIRQGHRGNHLRNPSLMRMDSRRSFHAGVGSELSHQLVRHLPLYALHTMFKSSIVRQRSRLLPLIATCHLAKALCTVFRYER